ncbi:MAG: hypothetical protein GTO22_07250 [Gemmatimonadales bacterium]|nr:hypothetical protein [Gemmatimonadales bacterium]
MSDDTTPQDNQTTPNEYYRAYEGHSRTLKTWLVAYGIGAPVLLLTNETLWRAVAASGESQRIGLFFLAGVALQVIVAAVNKVLMWASYFGQINPAFRGSRIHGLVAWLRTKFWVDLLVDAVSMLLFVVATYRVFMILTSGD